MTRILGISPHLTAGGWHAPIGNAATVNAPQHPLIDVDFVDTQPRRIQLGNIIYRNNGVLGEGGFGNVYRLSAQDGRSLALKTLKKEHCLNPSLNSAFIRQAQMMSELDHPAIVNVLAWGTEDSCAIPYVVMEYAPDHLFAKLPELTLEERMKAARDLVDALEYAHARNTVHADFHHRNILLRGAQVLITDFYVSALMDDAIDILFSPPTSAFYPSNTPRSHTNRLRKTDEWMNQISIQTFIAPEIMRRDDVDAAADTYSLAMLITYILSNDLNADSHTLSVLLAASDPIPQRRRMRFSSIAIFRKQFLEAAQRDGLPGALTGRFDLPATKPRPQQHRLTKKELPDYLNTVIDHLSQISYDLPHADVLHYAGDESVQLLWPEYNFAHVDALHRALALMRRLYAHHMKELAHHSAARENQQLLWPEDVREDILGDTVNVSSCTPILTKLYEVYLPERFATIAAASLELINAHGLSSLSTSSNWDFLSKQLLFYVRICKEYRLVAEDLARWTNAPSKELIVHARALELHLWNYYKKVRVKIVYLELAYEGL